MRESASVLQDVTVVIRSVGERTESLCKTLVLAQGIPEPAVFVVSARPFSECMRQAFGLGMEEARPWTLCVDADVLLRQNAVADLLQLARKQSENVCEIQGYVLDKFFGGPRLAGNHLYRTSLLSKVIDLIPQEGVNIRPEAHTLNSMKAAGYPWKRVRYLVGLHDFQQDFFDIFRKCFVQAHKHADIADLFLSVWRESAGKDLDCQVALRGFSSGVQYGGDVYIDADAPFFSETFPRREFPAKEPLVESDWDINQIEEIISNWEDSKTYRYHFPTRAGFEPLSFFQYCGIGTKGDRSKSSLVFLVGWFLQRLGARLKRWSG